MDSWPDLHASIRAAQGGERKAFEDVFIRYRERVAASIDKGLGRRLRMRVTVEDLVQETFLRAWRSIGQFRGASEPQFRGWLLAIAAHAVQDEARRNAEPTVSLEREIRAADGESWEIQESLKAQAESPSQGMRRNERFERLRKVLGTLRPDHARVILLARVQGLPIKEVARRMDRSPEATSMLLLRALLKLKEAFGHTDSFHLPERSLEEEDPRGR